MDIKSSASVNYVAYIELNKKLDEISKQLTEGEKSHALLSQRVVTLEEHSFKELKSEVDRCRDRLHEIELIPPRIDRLEEKIQSNEELTVRTSKIEETLRSRARQNWMTAAAVLSAAAAIVVAILALMRTGGH